MGTTRKMTPTQKRANLKESITEQLAIKGASLSFFEDLVEEYMVLWDIRNKLMADEKKRGVVYQEPTSTGIMQTKNNPSTKELLLLGQRMAAIRKELGLTTEEAAGGLDDEEL